MPATPDLQWIAHGPYLFKGTDEPIEVFEVGVVGVAPLKAPPDSNKARRSIPAGEEAPYGWRPAIGLPVPRVEQWILERKLGEGGFGEVWLAQHAKTGSHRVFKFCFDADRLRSFKRELTLFRILRDALGDRPDIAKIHDIQLEKPPFFLESEFTELGDLVDWSAAQGGIESVPLATRLDLMIRISDAVAAAHSIGILHKDIKPSNILIYESESGAPRPRLADFGIAAVMDRAQLDRQNITVTGFTETLPGSATSQLSGTRLYSPPETMVGQAFTMQGDIFALGVMLYQMVGGDLLRPLAHGWDAEIADPLLRDDIARCVAGRPGDRLGSASDLAGRLRGLDRRRRARRRQCAARIATAASIVLAALLLVAGGLFVRERGLRRQIADERDRAEAQAEIARAVNDFLNADLLAAVNPDNTPDPKITVRQALDNAAVRIEGRFRDQPVVDAAIRGTLGKTYMSLGAFDVAEPFLDTSLELRRTHLGEEHEDTLAASNLLGQLYYMDVRHDEAERTFESTLEKRRRVLGPEHADTLLTAGNLAGVYMKQGRHEEAVALYVTTLELQRRVLGETHDGTLRSMNNLGELYVWLGRFAEAEPLLTRTLEIRRERKGEEHPSTLFAMSNLGNLYRRQERYAEAETLLAATLETRRRVLGPEHGATLNSMNFLASLYAAVGRTAEAEPLYVETLETRRRVLGDTHTATLSSMSNLARLYSEQGRFDEALPLLSEAVAGAETTLPPDHWFTGVYLLRYGQCLTGLNRYDDAETACLEAHRILEAGLGADHQRTAEAVASIVALYDRWGKTAEARRWQAKLPPAAEDA